MLRISFHQLIDP